MYSVVSKTSKYKEARNTIGKARDMARTLSSLDGDAYLYKDKKLIEKWVFGKRESVY